MKEFMIKHPVITFLLVSKAIDCTYKAIDKHLDAKLPDSYWEAKKAEAESKSMESVKQMLENDEDFCLDDPESSQETDDDDDREIPIVDVSKEDFLA